MGYIYDEVKKAIGGQSVSKSHSAIDWSPNAIRALVIYRTFVIVAYHTKPPKKVNLDINRVQDDLHMVSMGRSRGAVHNFLSERQLSCLEEFYVDSAFQNYEAIFNLREYASKVINERARLRSYGYIQNSANGEDILDGYQKAQLNTVYDYSLAEANLTGTKVFPYSVNNTEWYRRYNLRPQFYRPDGEKGHLAVYFRKAEESVSHKLKNAENATNSSVVERAVQALIRIDCDLLKYYGAYRSVLKHCSEHTEDALLKRVHTSIKSLRLVDTMEKNIVPYATLEKIYESLKDIPKDKLGIVFKEMLSSKVVSQDSEIDLEKITALVSEGKGFLNMPTFLDSACVAASKAVSSMSKDMGFYSKITYKTVTGTSPLPACGLREYFSDIQLPEGTSDTTQLCAIYVEYLRALCGVAPTKY